MYSVKESACHRNFGYGVLVCAIVSNRWCVSEGSMRERVMGRRKTVNSGEDFDFSAHPSSTRFLSPARAIVNLSYFYTTN